MTPHAEFCLLQTADFGPKTALKIVDAIREDIRAGKVKTKNEVRSVLTAMPTISWCLAWN